MDFSAWLDGTFQQLEMVDIDVLVNAALCARTGTPAFPLSQPICGNGYHPTPTQNFDSTNMSHSVPTGDWGKTVGSLEGTLLEYPPRYPPRDPSPLPKRGPIYNVPVEILIRIFQLVAPPRTRNGLYHLSKLTHVCRFWRMALINQPRLWSAVFITQEDRRSFVEACLERSHPAMLDVTVEAKQLGEMHPDCTCDKGARDRLLPNESNPCEWHFQFELLAENEHSNRIRALDIEFEVDWSLTTGRARFALGSCRFFTLTFPRLTTLTWKNEGMTHADHLFSTPPFVPTLRSLTYEGGWNSLITQVNNLTSFSFSFDLDSSPSRISTEAFRLLMCNNRSLESLSLRWVDLEGDSKGPPVHLLNLKSLTVERSPEKLSKAIRIPAFQRLSSLRISLEDGNDMYKLSATGDDISITIESFLDDFAEVWEDLTGYAKPLIRHIRLYDGPTHIDHWCGDNHGVVVLLMMDAQTLEVGFNYLLGWGSSFWEDVKQLGTQLKTIRFEVSGDMEHDDYLDCEMWDTIEDLVKYRFDQGRPFSAVERLVFTENEREDRLQAYAWRCFYGTRKLSQYVRPAQA